MNSIQRPVFILMPADEMRRPYEAALSVVCSKIVWFNAVESLTASSGQSPLAVVVDLDALTLSPETAMGNIRRTFPGSELIALSSSDSASLALHAIRAGFVDYLLKPLSPEELLWSIRKSEQRHELLQKLQSSQRGLVKVLSQITNCNNPVLVYFYCLEFLKGLMGALGSAWIRKEGKDIQLLCSIPKSEVSQILFDVPEERYWTAKKTPSILFNPGKGARKLVLPCQEPSHGAVFLWGLKKKPSSQRLSNALVLMENSELTLGNIHKFEEIKQQTFVDDLTGLYNCRYLNFALTNAISKCKTPSDHFSVLFIDVDYFKKVNDTHGHLVGSEFLIAIARAIKHSVRNIDPVFRYGGDEFVILLNQTSVEGAKEIAERIRRHIERRVFVIQQKRIQTTVSIGLATYPIHAADRDILLRLADEAMYSAKRGTRNAVQLAEGLR